MAFPQGIYFRNLDNRIDPANYDAEVNLAVSYPWVTSQGNTVGWDLAPIAKADRSITATVILSGIHYRSNSGGATSDFRIDLPAPGAYRIRLAAGDLSAGQNERVQLCDDNTVFADYSAVIGVANWIDATGVTRTSEADWNANNALLSRTFTSSIFRIKIGNHASGTGTTTIAAVYIEEDPAAAGSTKRVRRKTWFRNQR
jgi:hypothetical protein